MRRILISIDYIPVVFMGCKYEEDAKTVAEPGESVKEVDPPGSVFSDEEVEESEGHCVTREHVVTTCPDTLQTEACTWPDYVGIVQTVGPSAVWPGSEYRLEKLENGKMLITCNQGGPQGLTGW